MRILAAYSPEFLKKIVKKRMALTLSTSEKMNMGFHPIEIPAGKFLVEEGGIPPASLLVLAAGRIIEKKGNQVVNVLGPGELLGFICLFVFGKFGLED